MKELIERLEKLTVPDRDLDVEIAIAIHGRPGVLVGRQDEPGGPVRDHTYWRYTGDPAAAYSLLPWEDHPGSTFTLKIIQSGSMKEQYCYAEFTWPSSECQGRARTPELATLICALRAVERTRRELEPYRQPAALKARETGK